MEGQLCLDETPAFVLPLFLSPSLRALPCPALWNPPQACRHRSNGEARSALGKARAWKYRSQVFSAPIPRNPLISPDSEKEKEGKGNDLEAFGSRKGSVRKEFGKERKSRAIDGAIQAAPGLGVAEGRFLAPNPLKSPGPKQTLTRPLSQPLGGGRLKGMRSLLRPDSLSKLTRRKAGRPEAGDVRAS